MRARRLFGILLDLAFLTASLSDNGAVSDGLRILATVLVAVLVVLVLFCAVALTLGILAQREPPYEF